MNGESDDEGSDSDSGSEEGDWENDYDMNTDDVEDEANMGVSIEFGDDINFSFQFNEEGTIAMMTAKFFDYFDYGMVQLQGDYGNKEFAGCPDLCHNDRSIPACCTQIKMFENGGRGDTYFQQYQCMDADMIDEIQGVQIDEFYYEVQCSHSDGPSGMMTWSSGASALMMGAVSSFALVSSMI